MNDSLVVGKNCSFGQNITIGDNVTIGHNCIIEDDVYIGNDVVIENNCLIRKKVKIGDHSYIGSNTIIGEYNSNDINVLELCLGENAYLRSGTIIYSGSIIGNNFQTGHHVVIRENSKIGNNVSVGTLSDIQGDCVIGNYVRLHSNVHIGKLSEIDDYVWIFPYVVLTNDPTPPSLSLVGVHICSFAIIATGAILLPGIEIGQDSLVGAGAVVTKSVNPYDVVVGNPAKRITDVRNVTNKNTGENVYPWRNYFEKYMPWDGKGFEVWYDSLSLEEKKKNNIKNILT